MLKWGMAAALAVCALPAAAAAADWRMAGLSGETGDRTLFLVDASSVEQPRRGEVRFEMMMLYQKPFQGVNRTMSRIEANCARRSFTLVSVRFFADEREMGEHRSGESVDAPAGSAFESVLVGACTREWGSRTIARPRDAADAIFSADDPLEAARNM
jgi:hypothetical protein